MFTRSYAIFFLLIVEFALGQKLDWDRKFGGRADEFLRDAIPTADYGLLLAGGSLSGATKSKATPNYGKLDFWIWKIDENGALKWERNFGGTENDICTSISSTKDGGFIIGGNSFSGKGDSKSSEHYGDSDFWILKLDAFGAVEWERSYGGSGKEELVSIIETTKGDFLILGNSSSDSSGSLTVQSKGAVDVLLIKVDKLGNELWQKSFGGEYSEAAIGVIEFNGKYLVGLNSNSGFLKADSQTNTSLNDAALLLLNDMGNLIGSQTLGGNEADDLVGFVKTAQDELFCLVNSNSGVSSSKRLAAKNGTDIWLVKLNADLEIIDQFQYNFSNRDLAQSLIFNKDELLISASVSGKQTENGILSDFLVLRVDLNGELKDQITLTGEGENILCKTLLSRDRNLFLAGTGDSKTRTGARAFQRDFRVAKFKFEKNADEARKELEVIPNPVLTYTNFIVGFSFDTGTLVIHDLTGKLVYTQEISDRTIPFDAGSLQPGIYISTVQTNNGTAGTKFIKASN